MALRTQTLNRGNIVTPICQYWPLAAEVGFTRGGEMPIVVVASEGQGGDPSPLMITAVCHPSSHVWTPRRKFQNNQIQLQENVVPSADPILTQRCSVSMCYGFKLCYGASHCYGASQCYSVGQCYGVSQCLNGFRL